MELDHDITVNFTIFKDQAHGKPLKQPAVSYSQLLSFLSTPKVDSKNSNFCFVGGMVKDWRNNDNTLSRSILTVDIDDVPADIDLFSHISSHFYYGFAMYSTHNHTPDKPRYRLVIPLNQNYKLSPEEYRGVIKYLCNKILDLPYYDPSSEVLSQVMFFPTTETPEYFDFAYQDEEILDLNTILPHITVEEETEKAPATEWINVLNGVNESEGKGRDSTAAALLGHLLRHYIDPNVAYELLICWNERNNPPLTIKDINRIFNSIFKKEVKRRNDT